MIYQFRIPYHSVPVSMDLVSWLDDVLDGRAVLTACSPENGYGVLIPNEEDASLFRMTWVDDGYWVEHAGVKRFVSL